jgi:hypothetical protein
MMYDRSNATKLLRDYCSLSLAWWHSYKWCTKMIMTVFANDFIAPLFHQLFPCNEFNVDKMGLPSQTCILTYIRLAYPSFRTQLIEAKNHGDLSIKNQTLLNNLTSLCEFFIPVVIYIYIL